jgi:hypothetical protein
MLTWWVQTVRQERHLQTLTFHCQIAGIDDKLLEENAGFGPIVGEEHSLCGRESSEWIRSDQVAE